MALPNPLKHAFWFWTNCLPLATVASKMADDSQDAMHKKLAARLGFTKEAEIVARGTNTLWKDWAAFLTRQPTFGTAEPHFWPATRVTIDYATICACTQNDEMGNTTYCTALVDAIVWAIALPWLGGGAYTATSAERLGGI